MSGHGKTIALLCARPPEQNTGMVTVDLAGTSLLTRAFPGVRVEPYYFGNPGRLPYPRGWLPFSYRDAWTERDAYLAADCRIVWGDFSHSAALWQPVREAWLPEVDPPTREDIARIAFLWDQPDALLRRSASFGGTIITNTGASWQDPLYREAFGHFYRRAASALLRDAISAAILAEFRPEARTLGIDCAFLNEDADLARLPGFAPAARQPRIGVFFGRTPGLDRLLGFAREFARACGWPAEWIGWFHTRRRQRLLVRARGFAPPAEQPPPGAALAHLASCSAIVTDTYHLAINAWRMGIPVVCIGTGAGAMDDSLADKKKEILFRMYGADGFYVFAETLRTGRGRRKAALAARDRVMDDALVSIVRERIAVHREQARGAFLSAVEGMLGG